MKERGEGKRGRGRGKEGPRPPPLVLFGLLLGRGRSTSWLLPSLSPMAHQGPPFPRGGPVTPRHSDKFRNFPEHFRCPNIVVQYINLYVSDIPRLLVMSVISSRTPN